MGKKSFIYKSKRRDRIRRIGSRKYWTSQKRGKYWPEITVAGVKTAAACV